MSGFRDEEFLVYFPYREAFFVNNTESMVSFLYVMSHFFDRLTLCSVLVCLNMSKRRQQLKTLSIVFF